MSSPFSVPFTPGQPSFLVPGPYPPVSYVARPAYTFSAPIPSPFQAFQYAAPPPGQRGSYALRPYPYPTWGPYASGAVDANWVDANAQTQAQMQMQMQNQGHVQGKAQRKRGRAAASGEDVLRIVLVQPKNFHDPATASPACAESSTSTSGSVRPICERPASSSIANGPSVDVSSTTHLVIPTNSEEQEAATVGVFLYFRLTYNSKARSSVPAAMFKRRLPPAPAKRSSRVIVRTLQDSFKETTRKNEVKIKAGA
jgi:hypothetical protein